MTKQTKEKKLIETHAVEVAQATQVAEVAEVNAEIKEVEAAQVLAIDEHAGKGGRYIFNPATGKRTAA